MRFTKQGVITTAEKAGCTVQALPSSIVITAPAGKSFPNGDTVLTTPLDAPVYDEVYPAIEALAETAGDTPEETYGDFGTDDPITDTGD